MSRHAFTLVEVIVVLAIILALAGLATPVLQIASKSARRTNTQALLGKVDAGLGRFRLDVGAYPWQDHDTTTPDFASIDNRLAYHLARTLDSAERSQLDHDAKAAAAAYNAGTHRFTVATCPIDQNQAAACQVLNRMGRERARLMIHAGHGDIDGVGTKAGVPLLTGGATTQGWGADYLGGDLPRRNIRGDAIVDYHGNPLLYVAPIVAGVEGTWVAPSILPEEYPRQKYIDASAVGFAARGRTVTTIQTSDIRSTAAAAYCLEPELWSVGADGRAHPSRDDRANADNLPARAYTKGLTP